MQIALIETIVSKMTRLFGRTNYFEMLEILVPQSNMSDRPSASKLLLGFLSIVSWQEWLDCFALLQGAIKWALVPALVVSNLNCSCNKNLCSRSVLVYM